MTEDEIQKERYELKLKIKAANERLKELRKLCTHSKTIIGTYNYENGQIGTSEICAICDDWLS